MEESFFLLRQLVLPLASHGTIFKTCNVTLWMKKALVRFFCILKSDFASLFPFFSNASWMYCKNWKNMFDYYWLWTYFWGCFIFEIVEPFFGEMVVKGRCDQRCVLKLKSLKLICCEKTISHWLQTKRCQIQKVLSINSSYAKKNRFWQYH